MKKKNTATDQRTRAMETPEETMDRLEREGMPEGYNAIVCECGHVQRGENNAVFTNCVFYVQWCIYCERQRD